MSNPGGNIRAPNGAKVTGVVVEIDPHTVKLFDEQPRTEGYSEDHVNWLAGRFKKKGQHTPVVVTLYEGSEPEFCYQLVDGEHRTRAAMQVGCMLKATVISIDAAERYKESVRRNFGRLPHTPIEIARIVKTFLDDEHMSWQDIVDETAMSEITLRNYYDLNRLSPELQSLFGRNVPKDKRLSIKVASELSRLPHSEQMVMYETVKKKPTSQAVQIIRKKMVELSESGTTVFPSGRGRKRKPSDDTDIAETQLRSIQDRLVLLSSMKRELKTAFQNRGHERNLLTMEMVRHVRDLATDLVRQMQDVMPESYREAVWKATHSPDNPYPATERTA